MSKGPSSKMTDKTVMLTLRIPETLRESLRRAAKAERRSVNSLVVMRLSKASRRVPA